LEKQFLQQFRKAQAAQCRSVIALPALALLGVAVALPTAASADTYRLAAASYPAGMPLL
jgi:hypothetical protein